MTVSVACRLVSRAGALSDSARYVLYLIEGGVEWLEWAIWHPRAQYRFDSEEALVSAVQVGLHGWHLLLVRGVQLLVGPARLMTLHRRDLRILAEAKDVNGRVSEVLSRNRLVTQPDLARDVDKLGELVGRKPLPVLQGMTLEDQLDIHALMRQHIEELAEGDRKEAALFAAERAESPREFADYARAYKHYVAADPHPPGKAGSRRARVGDAIDLLLPLLFEALDCPCVEGAAEPWEVAEAINEWLAMGRRLGFSRRSQLAEQIIAHTHFARCDPDEAPRIVARYLAGAQALLGSGELGRRRLGQDGTSSTFRIRSEAEEAILTLGRQGVVALSEFRPPPEAPAAQPESKRRK